MTNTSQPATTSTTSTTSASIHVDSLPGHYILLQPEQEETK